MRKLSFWIVWTAAELESTKFELDGSRAAVSGPRFGVQEEMIKKANQRDFT